MKVRIGIDIGGSTTKIIGMLNDEIIEPMIIKADDPVTSIFGAFGSFIYKNNIEISNVEKIMITGVGSTFIDSNIYGIETINVSEFEANALGGLYMAKKDKAIVVSLGTGTSIVESVKGGANKYIGGTAVGGGTIIGLSKMLFNVSDIERVVELSKTGNLANVDLTVSDIVADSFHNLENGVTASNFGKVSSVATKNDLALGVLNMVFQSIAMTAVFALRHSDFKDVVMIGNLSKLDICKKTFNDITKLTGVEFNFPIRSEFATALGAILFVK